MDSHSGVCLFSLILFRGYEWYQHLYEKERTVKRNETNESSMYQSDSAFYAE